MNRISAVLNNYFWFLLPALALLFLLAVASAATWGLPAIWHADERLYRVMPALAGELDTITEIVAYPSLPFYTMCAAGRVLSQFSADEVVVMAGIRVISAVLGALVIVLSALMTLTAGRSRPAALLASLLVMFSSGFATIAHHAIVDIYLTFFVALASFLLLLFIRRQKDMWLYLGFLAIGLAASSKYNGAALLLGATLIAVLFGPAHWRRDPLRLLGRLALAYGLALLAFLAGTPGPALNPALYLEQLLPFLERQRVYAGPRSLGLFGQWGKTLDGLGWPLLVLFALATVWSVMQAGKGLWARSREGDGEQNGRYTTALLLLLLSFELPIALSQFYPMRYMVPAYSLLAVLAALMVDDLWHSFAKSGSTLARQLLLLGTTAVLFLSGLRFASVILTYANDGRTAASAALPGLIEPGSRLEYTLYPPLLPREGRVVDNYPLRVFKFEEDIEAMTGWNMGEEGVELRRPDYLVVDRKTYSRFADEHVCRLNPVECDFFTRLMNGETNYELVQRFQYQAPPYLPRVKTDFANIETLLFARRGEAGDAREGAVWQNDLEAQLGAHIRLLGYDLEQTEAADDLRLTLYWNTDTRLAENYKVFVHCLDERGQIAGQSDSVPAGGAAPTETWPRDEIIIDEHIITLPEAVACDLQAGLYRPETGERLPVLRDGRVVEENALPLPGFP